MIDRNLYAVRNPLFATERDQPAYSTFLIRYKGNDYPVFLNDTAAEVLGLCDGTRRVSDIYSLLAAKYHQPVDEIEELLSDFWKMSSDCMHIRFTEVPPEQQNALTVFGSRDYWTPDIISVELTHRCPLRCKHCFLSAGNGALMSESTWQAILDGVVEMKVPQVQLTGGEPLLHPSFFNMADALLKNNTDVHIFTSGTVFSDEIFAFFRNLSKNAQRIHFQVSLDGLAGYHDEFRGVKGSFDRTIHFIRTVIGMGYKMIIGTTINDQPYSELEELCRFCKEIGVSVMRIGGISERGRAEENKIETSSDGISEILDLKQKLSDKFSDETFTIMLNEEHNGQERKYLMNCGLGQTSLKIGPDGSVFPCMMADRSFADINRTSLPVIQKKYSRLFEKLAAPGEETCSTCEDRLVCHKCVVEGCSHARRRSCGWHDKNAESINRCYQEG